MKSFSSFLLLSFAVFCFFSITHGCHNYHHRKKRQAGQDEILAIEQTRHLRDYFSECMERKTGEDVLLMWDTAIDITVLDSNWYTNTDEANCSEVLNRDSAACWKRRLNNYLGSSSSLLPFARECIDEYSGSYSSPTCNNGTWTRFFNQDRPTGNADAEDYNGLSRRYNSRILCRNPIGVDARLANGSDYRIAGQIVTISPRRGFICDNRHQIKGTTCFDYMVRFCCPIQTTRTVDRTSSRGVAKRQAGFTSTLEENRVYNSCLSQAITLPENREPLDIESVIELAEKYLDCNDGEGYDCILRLNSTLNNTEVLLEAWPYTLQAIARSNSPIASAVASCNQQVFPLQEVIDRILSGGRGWSAWTPWGHCPSRCGENGERLRRRTCLGGPPRIPPCLGGIHQSEPCSPTSCCHWEAWNQWTGCGSGRRRHLRIRRRVCMCASPGSEGCPGSATQTESCETERAGGWSQWTAWENCHAQCNQVSRQLRRRYCTTGSAGSSQCPGSTTGSRVCRNNCGTWSNWTEFSECAGSCGTSTKTRTRTCEGGEVGQPNCWGNALESRQCYTGRPC